MNYKPFVVGAASVVAGDFLESKLPTALDVGGLPVRKAVSAIAGAYGAKYALTGKPTLMSAAIAGMAALAAAELTTKVSPFEKTVGPFAVVRTLGAGAGAWAAGHFLHKD